MKIESTAFGPQISDPETRIVFPLGIPGFEQNTVYQLFHQEATDVVGYLQSVDDPDLVFSVLSPDTLNIYFEFTLTDDEQTLLKLEQAEDAALLLITYKQPVNEVQGRLNSATVNANFMAPLVINTRSQLGLQKVLCRTERRITIKAD